MTCQIPVTLCPSIDTLMTLSCILAQTFLCLHIESCTQEGSQLAPEQWSSPQSIHRFGFILSTKFPYIRTDGVELAP